MDPVRYRPKRGSNSWSTLGGSRQRQAPALCSSTSLFGLWPLGTCSTCRSIAGHSEVLPYCCSCPCTATAMHAVPSEAATTGSLVAQRLCVEVEGAAVGDAHVQAAVVRPKHLLHRSVCGGQMGVTAVCLVSTERPGGVQAMQWCRGGSSTNVHRGSAAARRQQACEATAIPAKPCQGI